MRIGIVACEILKDEIEHLTKDDPDFVHREYLEFALHEDSKNMKRLLIEKVNALEGKVDAVLLGYAICQSLENVTAEMKVPTVMIQGADCIDALLGREEYNREKKICATTWFMSPGWTRIGVQGLIKQFRLDSVEGYPPSFFLDLLFESYERCLFIDSGVVDSEEYTKLAQAYADELKLKLDCRKCGIGTIEESIKEVKKCQRSQH
ncbi:MAG: DUF1638 domain-containing protein [Methanomassiliicoccaceae archaeon]|nr:DUF1638 domain-containing protein [Methanomassiliicoccaceae archaeon]